jgi:hypothetical protein
MSKRIQELARERVLAARRRERNARERSHASEKRGATWIARLHRNAAELQGDAAAGAETLLELDRGVEGDRLGA